MLTEPNHLFFFSSVTSGNIVCMSACFAHLFRIFFQGNSDTARINSPAFYPMSDLFSHIENTIFRYRGRLDV